MMGLRVGDVLLYEGKGLMSRLIMIKTFSDVSHCEMVSDQDGAAWASRDGIGVGMYPLRVHGLKYIYRPIPELNVEAMRKMFDSFDGQGYDWLGLFRFFTIGKQDTSRQFCSELCARLLRAGNPLLLPASYDADLVSPGMFKAMGLMERIWEAGKGYVNGDQSV